MSTPSSRWSSTSQARLAKLDWLAGSGGFFDGGQNASDERGFGAGSQDGLVIDHSIDEAGDGL